MSTRSIGLREASYHPQQQLGRQALAKATRYGSAQHHSLRIKLGYTGVEKLSLRPGPSSPRSVERSIGRAPIVVRGIDAARVQWADLLTACPPRSRFLRPAPAWQVVRGRSRRMTGVASTERGPQAGPFSDSADLAYPLALRAPRDLRTASVGSSSSRGVFSLRPSSPTSARRGAARCACSAAASGR